MLEEMLGEILMGERMKLIGFIGWGMILEEMMEVEIIKMLWKRKKGKMKKMEEEEE